MTQQETPKQNDLAIASLVLGILSCTGAGPITGIPAIITGAMGMKNPHNKGMAVAGLVMGIVSTTLVVLGVLLFFLLLFLGVFAATSIDPGELPAPEPSGSSFYQQRT